VHGRSGDLDAYLRADTLFHRTLLEASGNERLRALHDVVARCSADAPTTG
jgi:DNA-binding GntR family transcriptional regulator